MTRGSLHLAWGFLSMACGATLAIKILYGYSPETSAWWPFALLYFGVFLFIFGLTLFLGYWIRSMIWSSEFRLNQTRTVRRQAILFGFLAVICLLLQSLRMLSILSAVSLLIIFFLLELYSQ